MTKNDIELFTDSLLDFVGDEKSPAVVAIGLTRVLMAHLIDAGISKKEFSELLKNLQKDYDTKHGIWQKLNEKINN